MAKSKTKGKGSPRGRTATKPKVPVPQARPAKNLANGRTSGPAATRKPTVKVKSDPAKAQRHERKRDGKGALNAAAQLLKEARKPMRCKELVETMLKRGLWQTAGKTPASTLYAAILREIQIKGKDARFRKVERGLFALNAKAGA